MQKPSLLITAKDELKHTPPANGKAYTLEEMQGLVGGYVQILETPLGHLMVMDEEGKFKKKPYNMAATTIMRSVLGRGDYVAGDVIYCDRSMVE
jgi:hypothetical protein